MFFKLDLKREALAWRKPFLPKSPNLWPLALSHFLRFLFRNQNETRSTRLKKLAKFRETNLVFFSAFSPVSPFGNKKTVRKQNRRCALISFFTLQGEKETHSCWKFFFQWWTVQARIQDFGQGSNRVLTPRGGWAPNFLKIGGFPLKLPETAGPRAPWIRYCCTQEQISNRFTLHTGVVQNVCVLQFTFAFGSISAGRQFDADGPILADFPVLTQNVWELCMVWFRACKLDHFPPLQEMRGILPHPWTFFQNKTNQSRSKNNTRSTSVKCPILFLFSLCGCVPCGEFACVCVSWIHTPHAHSDTHTHTHTHICLHSIAQSNTPSHTYTHHTHVSVSL